MSAVVPSYARPNQCYSDVRATVKREYGNWTYRIYANGQEVKSGSEREWLWVLQAAFEIVTGLRIYRFWKPIEKVKAYR